MEPADIQPPRTLQLQNNLEQEDPQFSARVLEQLRFHLYGAAIEDVKIIIITSRATRLQRASTAMAHR